MEQKNMEKIISGAGSELEEYLDQLFDTLTHGLTEKTKTPNRVVITLDTSGPTSRCCFSPYGRDQTSTIDGDPDQFLEDIIELKYFCGKLAEDADELHSLTRGLSQGTVFKYFWIFDELQQKLEELK